jgi:para-nitrobenzyl esterase
MLGRFGMNRCGKMFFIGMVGSLFLTANVVSSKLQAQMAGVLSNLEIGSYKTDIEYLRFPLDQPLSSSQFEYTATVDQHYTGRLFITATAPPNTDSELRIDSIAVKSGEPYPVELKEGANRFVITMSSSEATPATYHLSVIRKDLSREYRSESLGKGIWRIEDYAGARGDESFYLVVGKDRALLLDTGMGKGDLARYVRTLTSLPVDVAITHGHGDHFGQVDQFKESTVYMSEKDAALLPPALITPNFKWVKDGEIIDLGGGRQFEVIEVPGHTLGSVIYLDRNDRLAVTGDAVSSGSMVYMFGTSCTTLDQYVESMKRLNTQVKDLDGLTLLVGHRYQEKVPLTAAEGKQLFTDMHIAAEKVVRGELQGKMAVTHRDGKAYELRQAYFGLAGLWYNPNNIHTSPAALGLLDLKTSTGKRVVSKPVFSSMQTSYSVALPDQSTTVEVTPTAYRPDYKALTVNGDAVKSGEAHLIALASGTNKIEITVTTNDGLTRTYTLLIQR